MAEQTTGPPATPPAQSLSTVIAPGDSALASLAQRTVSLVAEALARFELLLVRNEHRLNDHETMIAGSIREKALGIRQRLETVLQILASGDKSLNRRVFVQAKAVFGALQKCHRDLRHLSVPSVLPESITFINFVWQALLEHDLPQSSQDALQHSPALCLSDSMEPSEHSIQDVSVVALAKIDNGNALAWPLLIHELGHNAIRDLKFDLTNSESNQIVSNTPPGWFIEMGCDLIGLRLAGPAYLAPFIFSTLTDKSFLTATSRHPSSYERAQFLLSVAESWNAPSQLLAILRELVQTHLSIEQPIHQQLNISGTQIVCESCGKSYSSVVSVQRGNVSLERVILQIDESLPLSAYDADRYRTAEHIAASLRDGSLSGSWHDRIAAEAAFKAFENAKSQKAKKSAFKTVRNAVCDKPNNLFDIATAGWIRHLETSLERLSALLNQDRKKDFFARWEDFKISVEAADDLLRASMESAAFHHELRGLKDY